MQLDNLLISIVVISMITIGVGALITDLSSTYNIPVSPQFEAQFNKFNQTYSLSEDITEDIKGASVEDDAGTDWNIGKTVIAALNAIKVVFVQGIPTVFSTITSMGSYIPLPEFVIRGLQAIMLIAVAFSLAYLYFRYKN